MKSNAPPIVTAPQPASPALRPELLFAVQDGYGNPHPTSDSDRFPRLEAIRARYSAKVLKALDAFALAMVDAQHRVWILDGYLLQPDVGSAEARIELLCDWMPVGFAANDVKLLTRSQTPAVDAEHERAFAEHARRVNEHVVKRSTDLVIQTKFTLARYYGYVHDRFAIIDDELWHFGAAVAGLHRELSATTRGWHVNDCDAERFFQEAWNADLNEKARKLI